MNAPCKKWEDALARSLSEGMNEKERGDLDSHLGGCGRCRNYMEALKADDEILTELADEAEACGARIESGVLQALREEAPPRSRTAFLPTLFTPRRLAGFATAAAAVLLIVGLVVFTGDKSVYADVVKALEKIKTMRATGEQTRADSSVETMLLLYDRDLGTYMKETRDGKFHIAIENGRHEWQYHSGNTLAVRRKISHLRVMGMPSLVYEILSLEEFREALEKPPVGIESVDGRPCRVYRGTYGKAPIHYGLWIDERNLVLKYEEARETDDGEIRVEELARFYYDEKIDPERFKPDFGPGVKILEGDEAFREQFNPAGAIFTQEHFGLDFTVHELKPCEDGKVYMVASLQPTTQTIAEIGPVPVSRSGMSYQHEYGSFQFTGSWKRFEDHSIRSYYTFQTLAELNHDGLTVIWIMWYPHGDWPEMEQVLLYAAYIHSRNELKEKLVTAGEKWYARIDFPPLPLPEEKIADREAYRRVFDQVVGLEPVANIVELILGSEPLEEPGPGGEKLLRSITSRPSRISFEDCEAAWRKGLEREKKANLEIKRGRRP